MTDEHTDRIAELTRQLEELRKRMPAHSIPPAMMAEMDDLEEQLSAEKARQHSGAKGNTPTN
ncbi:MAG: hypothetical protein P8046_15250 [Anaerolineales bacterium]